jgi:hypothetical protein
MKKYLKALILLIALVLSLCLFVVLNAKSVIASDIIKHTTAVFVDFAPKTAHKMVDYAFCTIDEGDLGGPNLYFFRYEGYDDKHDYHEMDWASSERLSKIDTFLLKMYDFTAQNLGMFINDYELCDNY